MTPAIASISFLMFNNSCSSLMIVTFSPIGAEHILIIPSFFSTINILAKYRLLLEWIIFLSSKAYISCCIFLYIGGLNVLGQAMIGKGCIKCILYFSTLVLSKLLLLATTIFLNWSRSFLKDLGSCWIISIVFNGCCTK